MHFILLLALVPCLCVLSVDIPSQPESPVGGNYGNQQLLTGFDNAQQQFSAAANEINSENPGSQLIDDKKSSTSSVTRHQFKVCSSMTILPLHDYGSCSRTIHRLAGAVCRGAGNGNLGVNSLGFGGRSRRSSSSTGSAGGGDEANGEEEELEDALLEFTNGNRDRNHHNQNGFWAQEQQQQKRAANFYGNQQQQQQPQFQQQQPMYGGHHGGLISVGHHEQVKKELIRKCCKYSNVCQIEFVVENLSDSCNGQHSYQQQQHQQKEQPLHVAKARA